MLELTATTKQGTVVADKHEIMFTHGLNYNNEPAMYKKGTVLYRNYELQPPIEGSTEILQTAVAETGTDLTPTLPTELSKTALEKDKKSKQKAGITIEHCDLMRDEFWQRRPWILSGNPGKSKRAVTTA